MAEYIEREAAINEIDDTTWYHISCQKNLVEGAECEADALYKATDIYNAIKSVPTADVVEVKHGKWIRPNVPNTRSYKWQCSECGQIAYWLHYGNRGNKNIICKFGYCPNCGAKMDGGNNNA